jgi:hypothetical protein
MAFRPAVLNGHTLPLDITAFLQTLAKRDHHRRVSPRRRTVEKSDHRHRRLLRARCERPCCGGATKQPYEFTSSDGDCHAVLLEEVVSMQ